MADRVHYEALVEDFSRKLITQLRAHGADRDYLEMWVPDEDPVKSILNMVEAAAAYGRKSLEIEISAATITPDQLDALSTAISPMAELGAEHAGRTVVLSIKNIA